MAKVKLFDEKATLLGLGELSNQDNTLVYAEYEDLTFDSDNSLTISDADENTDPVLVAIKQGNISNISIAVKGSEVTALLRNPVLSVVYPDALHTSITLVFGGSTVIYENISKAYLSKVFGYQYPSQNG